MAAYLKNGIPESCQVEVLAVQLVWPHCLQKKTKLKALYQVPSLDCWHVFHTRVHQGPRATDQYLLGPELHSGRQAVGITITIQVRGKIVFYKTDSWCQKGGGSCCSIPHCLTRFKCLCLNTVHENLYLSRNNPRIYNFWETCSEAKNEGETHAMKTIPNTTLNPYRL